MYDIQREMGRTTLGVWNVVIIKEKIRENVQEKEEALLKSREVNALNTELRLLVDKLRGQEESLRVGMDERESARRKETETIRAQLRDCQRDLAIVHRSR